MNNRPTLVALEQGVSRVKTSATEEKTMEEFYDEVTADVMARTLWGEARGEGTQGMHAVANVILNRVAIAGKHGTFWWGENVIQVCQKPYQFSCWNRSDPNFRKLQSVDASNLYFATAQRIAARAMAGTLDDITSGATHYHTLDALPYWAKGKKPCMTLGNHALYSLIS